METILGMEVSAMTDAGLVRENNEDAYIAQAIWDDSHYLVAAIDGMGGTEGGEVAADIARNAIPAYLTDFAGGPADGMIRNAVAAANNEIYARRSVQPRYAAMGCVATAGIFDVARRRLHVAHVGDSRLYRYAGGVLLKLTHDHSFVGRMEESGVLSEEEAMRHPRRSVIERCLGAAPHLADDPSFIEAASFRIAAGDTYIFCSDGLSDMLTSVEIAGCLGDCLSSGRQCANLVEKALSRGGRDNVTVVVAVVRAFE